MSFEMNRSVKETIYGAESVVIPLTDRDWYSHLGSALALSLVLREMGKDVSVVLPPQASVQEIDFLPTDMVNHYIEGLTDGVISIDTHQFPVKELKYEKDENTLRIFLTPELRNLTPEMVTIDNGGYQHDLVITLNTLQLSDLGETYEQNQDFFHNTKTIALSTLTSHDYASIHWSQPQYSGTGELVYQFLKQLYSPYITDQICTGALFSMIVETDNFQKNIATSQTLIAASELLEHGAQRQSIVNSLYQAKSLPILKLVGRIMAHLDIVYIGHLTMAFSKLYSHDFEKTKTTSQDIPQALEELHHLLPEASVLHIMRAGENIKRGTIQFTTDELPSNLDEVLDGEWKNGVFVYSYPSEGDVHTACEEVNTQLRTFFEKATNTN